MALNRISGLGMLVLGSFMLYAGCDSGGTTGTPSNSAGGTAGSTGGASNSNTGGAMASNTGGAIASSTGGAIASNTGGKANTTTGGAATSASCNGKTPPTATGTLSVSSGYVTTGTLKGYGFTWVGDQSNSTTCVTPTCNTNGCLPLFGATALCGAGTVTADTSYNSVVGIGFNLNQDSKGDTPGNVAAPSNVTVTATVGSGTGDAHARIQLVDSTGASYCVDAGAWTSGTAISIGSFNTKCWDGSGTPLDPTAQLQAIDIIVPSDSLADRDFSICLTGVTFS